MDTTTELDTYPGATPVEILDLVVSELAVALELLTSFELHDADCEDRVETSRPGASDAVRIAFRIGVTGEFGARLGYVLLPLADAMVMAGSLLMLPTAALRAQAEKTEPDSIEKDALMEAGHLISGSLDALLSRRFNGRVEVCFAGCQGVPAGEAPWVPGYAGDPFAVRKQVASFGALEPFEFLVAIPV